MNSHSLSVWYFGLVLFFLNATATGSVGGKGNMSHVEGDTSYVEGDMCRVPLKIMKIIKECMPPTHKCMYMYMYCVQCVAIIM